MGSKSPTQQTTVNQPNPQAMAAYQNVVNRAQNVANTPYTPYSGELVSPVNAEQNLGISNINAASGVANPYINSATNYANLGAAAINPTQFSAGALNQYLSPYNQQVIQATEAQIQNQNAQQQQQVVGNAITSGAWGGDRAGIAQSALAGQQALAENQTIAGLENQNYAQALGEFNTQQQTLLGAQQNNAARAGEAAFTLGSLGQEAQNTALTGAGAQLQAGGLQQGTQQALDTALYQQFLNQQAYPFQTTGWLGNLVEGTGSQMGGTSTTSQAPPSTFSQLAGLGILGAGLFLNRGGVVPHMAAGGSAPMPYEDEPQGAQGYVPQLGPLSIGHTMPTGTASLGNNNPVTQSLQTLGTLRQAGLGKQDGMAAPGQSSGVLGTLASDIKLPFTGLGDLSGLATGGVVPPGYSPFRPGYDDGGDVGDLTYDPGVDQPTLGDLTYRPSSGGVAPQPVSYPTDDSTFDRMIHQESGGQQFASNGQPLTSSKGAVGVAQVMPSTGPEAAAYAGLPWDPNRFRTDADYNAALGKAYFERQLHDFGSPDRAAAAYNAGPGAVNAALAKADQNGGSYLDYLPQETRDYVAHVTNGSLPGMGPANLGTPPMGGGYGIGLTPYQQPSMAPLDTSGGSKFGNPLNQALIAAGLGIMGSTSHNPLVAIGQGGSQGLQAFNSAQQIQRQNALAGAQIGYQQGELQLGNRRTDIEADNLLRQTQLTAAQIKNETAGVAQGQENIDISREQLGRQNYLANVEAASKLQTPTPVGMLIRDPNNPGAPGRLVPWDQYYSSTGANPGNAAKPAPGGAVAPAPVNVGASTPPSAVVPTASPAAGSAAAPVMPGHQYTPPHDVPVSTLALSNPGGMQKQSGDIMDQAQKSYDSANSSLLALDQMKHDFADLPQTGWLAQGSGLTERADIANHLNSVLRGLGVGDDGLINPSAVGSIENLQKLSTRMGYDLAKTLGSREAAMIVQGSIRAVPNVDNSPVGAQRLVAGIEAALQRQKDLYQYLNQWQHDTRSGGDVTDAEVQFNKDNPVDKYVREGIVNSIPQTFRDRLTSLKDNPDAAKYFDQRFGQGSAAMVLGQ